MWDEVRDASYEVLVFLSQSPQSIGEMIVFFIALRNIGNVLGSAFFLIIVNSYCFYTQRFFLFSLCF